MPTTTNAPPLAKQIKFSEIGDQDGYLIALESSKNVPFEIKRMFYIYDTKAGVTRGYHAHKKLRQVLICLTGSCSILLDNGHVRETVQLDNCQTGLLIEPHLWHEMNNFSPGTVLVSLTDAPYDEADYLRSYEEFLDYWKCSV